VLSEEMSFDFAVHWVKKGLIPHIRRACEDKIEEYTSQLARTQRQSIKEELVRLIEKNVEHLKNIDELFSYSDIMAQTSIMYKTHFLAAENKEGETE